MRMYNGWRSGAGRAAAIAALVCSLGATAVAAETPWRCGAAAVKITPSEPLWMAGYGSRTHPSEGTLHELWVKALALETADGHRAVVVCTDLLGFSRGTAQAVRAAAAERFGLKPQDLMLTSSHTHCGPVLDQALTDIYPLEQPHREAISRYTQQFVPRVVECIGQAVAKLEPVSLWAGEGKTDFAANRRNNTEAKVVELRAKGQPTVGPSDHAVPVLAARAAGGDYRALVFGYACHNTTLSTYEWCGDYAGFAQLAVEKRHPGARAFFYMGCGADQNPMPRRTLEYCEEYGQKLAAAVDQALNQPLRSIGSRLRTAFTTIELPFGEQPTAEDLEKRAKQKNYEGRWAARLLGELRAGRKFAVSYPEYPVQVWKLGADQLWIVLGGEVVVDYSLRFKKQYGAKTWVTGYANDVMAYIPSHRIWEEGRYEAGAFNVYGLPATRWREDIEERVSACVERLAAEVNR